MSRLKQLIHEVHRRSRWQVLLAGLGTVACDTAAESEAGHAVRDSAGVRIVENLGQGAAPGEWQLGGAPILQIGVLEGVAEYQLHEVSDLARLSDGRIVVASGGSKDLRLYSDDGAFLESVGGEGDGPGEFRSLTTLMLLPGDSLLAYDRALNRISYFDRAGVFLRSVSLQPLQVNTVPRFGGRFNDGSLLVTAERVFTSQNVERNGIVRDPVLYLRYDSEGRLADTLTSLPGTEYVVRVGDLGLITTNLPAGKRSLHVLDDDRLFVGTNDAYEIRVLGPDGSLHLIVRKAHEQVSLPRSRLERFLDSVLAADVEDDNLRRQLRQMFADVPLPETVPAFASLTVDTDGDLWVKESAFPDTETNRWTVFGVDGVLLAQVDMLPRFTPHHVGADFVLGVWTDEFEVEYVRLYELTKP